MPSLFAPRKTRPKTAPFLETVPDSRLRNGSALGDRSRPGPLWICCPATADERHLCRQALRCRHCFCPRRRSPGRCVADALASLSHMPCVCLSEENNGMVRLVSLPTGLPRFAGCSGPERPAQCRYDIMRVARSRHHNFQARGARFQDRRPVASMLRRKTNSPRVFCVSLPPAAIVEKSETSWHCSRNWSVAVCRFPRPRVTAKTRPGPPRSAAWRRKR